jgi:glycosyltransferase involved in cell wall biosynthesis
MSQPPTVCYVIIGLDYAGAEIQLVEVIRRMRARGWRIFVVSLITPAAFVRELRALGVEVVSLDLDRGAPLTPALLARFLSAVAAIRPDVIHGHMVHSNLLARLAAATLGIPVAVATVHSTDEGGRLRAWMYRLTERWGSVTTSVSAAGRDIHVGAGASRPERIRVLPNGIDTERFRPDPEARARVRRALDTPPNRFVWLSVTRFHWPKDPPTLLRALARLPGGSELWLVGQGADRAETEALAGSLGLGGRARFLGLRTDVPDLLAASDAFVLSSMSEAMPIALLEAASAGLVSVASDTGAVRDLVDDGRTGLVVPVADVDALAGALAQIERLTSAERAAMGRTARARVVERFALDAVVDRWEALYAETGVTLAGRAG